MLAWLRRLMSLLHKRGGTPTIPEQIGIGTQISDATIEVVEGGSAVDVLLNLFRSGGYTGDVTISALSLPAGVSVSFPYGATFSGADAEKVVRFVAEEGATPIINDSATIRASGTGVDPSDKDITVTILAGAAEPETIAIAPDDDTVSIPQGGSVVVSYTLARGGGYAGNVTLAITGLPTGVTASLLDGATWSGSATVLRAQLTAAADAPTVTNDVFTATATGSGVTAATDNGTVTVSTAIDPDDFAPNEPVDYTLLGDTTFDSLNPPGAWDATLPFTARPPSIQNVPGPYAPTSLRLMMNAGMTSGGFGIVDCNSMPSGGVEEMHTVFTWAPDVGFLQHTWQTKVLYPWRLTGGSPATTQDSIFGTRRINAAGDYFWWLSTQSGAGLASNYFDNQDGYSQQNPRIFNPGQLLRVETQYIHNTPGVKNGVFRLWVSVWNGSAWGTHTLQMQHTDVAYSASGQPGKWQRQRINAYHGGSAIAAISNDQHLYVNRMRISYKENS